MARQLNLDRDKLDQCYETAGHVVALAWKYIQRHSSFGIERAALLHLGVEGEYRGEPLASRLAASLTKDQLRLGAACWWGRVLASQSKSTQEAAADLIRGKIKWDDLPPAHPRQIQQLTQRPPAEKVLAGKPTASFPFGLFLKDTKAKRLRNAAHDWLKKEEGFALLEFDFSKKWEENWRDEEYKQAWEISAPERAVAVLGGLSASEQAVLACQKGFACLQPNNWQEVQKRETDTHRGLVDLAFVLCFAAPAGLKILTPCLGGRPADVFIHLLLFEQMAQRAGLSFENVFLSVEAPEGEISDQVAWLQLLREAFPQSELWLKFAQRPHPYAVWAAAFAEIDRLLFCGPEDLHQVKGEWKKLGESGQEFQLNTHGKIARQAQHILDQVWRDLKKIQSEQLWKFLEGGTAGREGVFQKSYHYWNPLWQASASS